MVASHIQHVNEMHTFEFLSAAAKGDDVTLKRMLDQVRGMCRKGVGRVAGSKGEAGATRGTAGFAVVSMFSFKDVQHKGDARG